MDNMDHSRPPPSPHFRPSFPSIGRMVGEMVQTIVPEKKTDDLMMDFILDAHALTIKNPTKVYLTHQSTGVMEFEVGDIANPVAIITMNDGKSDVINITPNITQEWPTIIDNAKVMDILKVRNYNIETLSIIDAGDEKNDGPRIDKFEIVRNKNNQAIWFAPDNSLTVSLKGAGMITTIKSFILSTHEKKSYLLKFFSERMLSSILINLILCISDPIQVYNYDSINGKTVEVFYIIYFCTLISTSMSFMCHLWPWYARNVKQKSSKLFEITSLFLVPLCFLKLFKSSTKCFILLITTMISIGKLEATIRDFSRINLCGVIISFIFQVLCLGVGLYDIGCTVCDKPYRWSSCSEINFDMGCVVKIGT